MDNFFNNYKVNQILRKYMLHIGIFIGLVILFFINRILAGVGAILWIALTILFYLEF